MLAYLLNLDYWVFTQINSVLTFPLGDLFFPWISDLQKNFYFKIIFVPLVALLFIRKFKREGVTIFLLLLLAVGVSDFVGGRIKHWPQRERPDQNTAVQVVKRSEAGGYSFYSNHASNMFTFATFTSQFIPQLKIPLYLTATSVAYSRVYNGVHYPSDSLAGSLIGFIWGVIFSRLTKKLLFYLRNRKKSA